MNNFPLIPNNQLYHRESGCGETIILLHGYQEDLTIWDAITEKLNTRYRTIAIDIPGHGFSRVLAGTPSMKELAKAIISFLKEKEISTAIFIGHSMGGYIAMEIARNFPKYVKGLFLLHSTPLADTAIKRKNRKREILFLKEGKKQFLLSVRSIPIFAEVNQNTKKIYQPQLNKIAQNTSTEGMIYALMAMLKRPDNSNTLKKISKKSLLLVGRHDKLLSLERVETVRQLIPELKIELLNNSGHMGFLEEEEKVITSFNSLVQRLNTPEPSTNNEKQNNIY